MLRTFGLAVTLFGCCLIAGCPSTTECITEGTSIAVSHTDGAGDCPDAVVAGVTALNANDIFKPVKDLSCGVTHFSQTVNFFAQDTNHAMCTGMDKLTFNDLTAQGGAGTDTMTITCTDSTSCTETFDVTFTPQ